MQMSGKDSNYEHDLSTTRCGRKDKEVFSMHSSWLPRQPHGMEADTKFRAYTQTDDCATITHPVTLLEALRLRAVVSSISDHQ